MGYLAAVGVAEYKSIILSVKCGWEMVNERFGRSLLIARPTKLVGSIVVVSEKNLASSAETKASNVVPRVPAKRQSSTCLDKITFSSPLDKINTSASEMQRVNPMERRREER